MAESKGKWTIFHKINLINHLKVSTCWWHAMNKLKINFHFDFQLFSFSELLISSYYPTEFRKEQIENQKENLKMSRHKTVRKYLLWTFDASFTHLILVFEDHQCGNGHSSSDSHNKFLFGSLDTFFLIFILLCEWEWKWEKKSKDVERWRTPKIYILRILSLFVIFQHQRSRRLSCSSTPDTENIPFHPIERY